MWARFLHSWVKNHCSQPFLQKETSIIFDGFDERQVALLGAAERVPLHRGAFIGAETYSGAESESFGFGGKFFGFGENESVVGVKIFLEAVNVFILDEVNGERVGDNVNLNSHNAMF